MSQEPLSIVVLAAGKGTRMRNGRPKVLHPLAGWPLVRHVLATARSLEPERLVVVLAPGMEEVAREVRARAPEARIAIQDPPLGTGHAVAAAREELAEAGAVLVLYADTPLLSRTTLARLLAARAEADAAVAVLAIRPPDPSGYGRLRLSGDDLVEIVEERHASPDLAARGLCNSGVVAFDARRLPPLLAELPLRADKNEYYLTDTVTLAAARGWRCRAVEAPWIEGLGVNSQRQLAELERLWQERRRAELLEAGVVMPAPDTVFVGADCDIEPGAIIEPYVVLGPGVRIRAGAVVHSFSHLEGAEIAGGAAIGPFARLRPGTVVEAGARIGNFVETKAARIGAGAKANHLAYLGDASVGAGANVGAGTITCNYDGFAKHRTEIGAGAFIGSNSALVAPVRIGEGAFVAAGSTVTEDVPDDALAIARSRQETRPGRAALLRQRLQKRARPREAG
ncbi:MAG: bifunctional UDP-N-acetylglucosamine diphosphorylase/glucosamine-1-phosphate N-acetyltransferase GlmU [Geminicoccaceae bacterium]|nr:bifunctional UDP-N-acetylglucosamine diphosphorylase/glucosamine-1-phosphate N-acetyltransferase GlmU [Geminicoccaceae bacterium]